MGWEKMLEVSATLLLTSAEVPVQSLPDQILIGPPLNCSDRALNG